MGHVLADSRNKHAKGNELETPERRVWKPTCNLMESSYKKTRICPKRPAGHPIQKVPPKGTMLLTVAGG